MVGIIILIVVLLFVVVVGGLALVNQSTALVAQSSAIAMNSATSLITQITVSLLIFGGLAIVGWLLYRRNQRQQALAGGKITIIAPSIPQVESSGFPALPDTSQHALPENPGLYPLLKGEQVQPTLPELQPSDFWGQNTPWES